MGEREPAPRILPGEPLIQINRMMFSDKLLYEEAFSVKPSALGSQCTVNCERLTTVDHEISQDPPKLAQEVLDDTLRCEVRKPVATARG